MVPRYGDFWIPYRYLLELWISTTHALSSYYFHSPCNLTVWLMYSSRIVARSRLFVSADQREREREREWQRVIEISHTCNFVRFNWNAADVADCPIMRAKSFPSWFPDDELFSACRVTRRSFHFGHRSQWRRSHNEHFSHRPDFNYFLHYAAWLTVSSACTWNFFRVCLTPGLDLSLLRAFQSWARQFSFTSVFGISRNFQCGSAGWSFH